MELDKDTRAALSSGRKIETLVQSEGWAEAKNVLLNKLATLNSITSIPKTTFEEVGKQAVMREGAISLVLEWINEVEGLAAQSEHNREALTEIQKESIIKMFD